MAPRKAKAPVTKSSNEFGWRGLESLFGAKNAIINRISEAQTLCQSAFTAATDVITQDISKNKLRLYFGEGDDQRVVTHKEHPVARYLALRPNKHHTWREFAALVVAHLVTSQNSYILKQRKTIADLMPDLMPLQTSAVELRAYQDQFFYDITAQNDGQAAILGFRTLRASQDDVIHLRFRQWDGFQGLSTLVIGADVFGLNQMITEFQAALTKNGTRPGSVITVPGTLSDVEFARLKDQVQEAYDRASRSGKPLVVEQGSTVSKLSFNAAEMDMVRAKTQIHQEVARLLRMPAYKIGLLESIKAENLGQMEDAYVDDTLVPVCGAIEDALSQVMLTDDERLAGYKLMFDRFQLYNRDPAATAARVIEAYKFGVIRRGQASVRLGYGPVPEELDTYSIPVNTAIMHRDGRLEFVTPNKDQPGDAPALN